MEHYNIMTINRIQPSSAILPALVLALLSLLSAPGPASDLAREKRLAEQTVDAILDGEPLWLAAGSLEFLGIEMVAENKPPRGAVIILHGRGMHPDWAQVVRPLRIGLPAHGWTTLSLQMPVLDKEASYYDYETVFHEAIPRIEAGIDHLQAEGYEHIVLLAHSCGVHMSMAWLDAVDDPRITAYIGIGMGATDYGQPMRKPFPFEKLSVPFLSLTGSDDYPAVQRMADAITARMERFHPLSAQREISDAGHYYDGHETELVEAVAQWLERLGKDRSAQTRNTGVRC